MDSVNLPIKPITSDPLELCGLTISAASKALHAGDISALELVDAYLQRIEALNPSLTAYISVTADRALEDARKASTALAAGKSRGFLHGIPIALGDLYKTAGIRTTAGSKIHSDYVPQTDSVTARRLRSAGTVLLGKLNTHEYAFGVTTDNPHYGTTHNPWSSEHTPGGSSGGAGAAVAAGLATAALGTDTGGNLRIPAAACGTVGLKPSYGLASKAGVLPLSNLFDHVGPVTRTVEDAAIMLQAIAGHDSADKTTLDTPTPHFRWQLNRGIKGLKIGVPRDYFFTHLEEEVRVLVEQAIDDLRALGAIITNIELKNAGPVAAAAYGLVHAEAREIHHEALHTRPFDFGEDVHELLASPASDAATLKKAMHGCGALARTVREAFTNVDLMLTPTMPVAPVRIGQSRVNYGDIEEHSEIAMLRFTAPFNATGHPALSLPCGFTAAGLPVGLQMVGQMLDDATLIQAAHTYEQAKGWYQYTPR